VGVKVVNRLTVKIFDKKRQHEEHQNLATNSHFQSYFFWKLGQLHHTNGMLDFNFLQALLGPLIAVFPRITAMFMAMPFLSSTVPSYALRGGLGLAISIYFSPIAMQWSGVLELAPLPMALFFMKEISIGFLIGISLGVIWNSASTAGAIIDSMAGTSNGNIMDPATHQEQTVYSSFLGVATTAILFSAGFFQVMISALIWSYSVFPVSSYQSPVAGLSIATWMGNSMLDMAVKIAAPFIVILGLVDLLFGLLNRYIQQLSSSTFTQALKPAITLLMFIVGFATLADFLVLKLADVSMTMRTVLKP
jgi:flagellar biosynthesis protein FliR